MIDGFGLRLEGLREKAGYTKKEVSKKLNFSDNVYGEYERERAKPTFDTAVKLAALFNVSLDYLVYGEEFQHDAYKAFEMLIRTFQDSGITDPYILQLEEWYNLNNDDIKYLQLHFEWIVQAKTRK